MLSGCFGDDAWRFVRMNGSATRVSLLLHPAAGSAEQGVDERGRFERGRSSGLRRAPPSLTGTPSSCWTRNTMPPLAVPSSFVSTTPVMSTTSANTRAWASPFCPMVASRTSSTSSTAAARRLHDPLDLAELVHQARLGCRRPAVSITTTSAPGGVPVSTASKAHRRGIGSLCALDHLGADAGTPNSATARPLRLECVRRTEHHRASVRDHQNSGQFADGGGLTGAVDADDQQHRWLVVVGQTL